MLIFDEDPRSARISIKSLYLCTNKVRVQLSITPQTKRVSSQEVGLLTTLGMLL